MTTTILDRTDAEISRDEQANAAAQAAYDQMLDNQPEPTFRDQALGLVPVARPSVIDEFIERRFAILAEIRHAS